MPNRVRGNIASKAKAEKVSAKQRQEIRRYSQATEDVAAAALAAHVAAGDPHTGYRLESADHTHQSTGAEAGQLDHGLALTGLGDDDHTQYLLADGTRVATTLAIGASDSMTVNGSAVTSQLKVHDDTQAITETHTHSNTAGSGGVFYMARSRGTEASETVVQSGDTLGSIASVGYDGTDYALAGRIDFIVGTTPGSDDMPCDIVLKSSNDGAQAPQERLRCDYKGNVSINNAAIATTATDGFLYVPTCAGTPTGTPTTKTGLAPIVVDSTNNKLYFYSGGAWRDAGP